MMGMIGSFLGPLSSVQALMNPVVTILKGVMEVVGPVVNTLLKPLVGILKIIGNTLGQILVPVLKLLTPVIEWLVKGFIWAYNALVDAINWALGWLGVNIKKTDAGAIDAAGDAELKATTGSDGYLGTKASYEKQRDISVNITLNTQALVGESGFREFCVAVGREIKSANVLGLA
jgi:hypothetical protein